MPEDKKLTVTTVIGEVIQPAVDASHAAYLAIIDAGRDAIRDWRIGRIKDVTPKTRKKPKKKLP